MVAVGRALTYESAARRTWCYRETVLRTRRQDGAIRTRGAARGLAGGH